MLFVSPASWKDFLQAFRRRVVLEADVYAQDTEANRFKFAEEVARKRKVLVYSFKLCSYVPNFFNTVFPTIPKCLITAGLGDPVPQNNFLVLQQSESRQRYALETKLGLLGLCTTFSDLLAFCMAAFLIGSCKSIHKTLVADHLFDCAI